MGICICIFAMYDCTNKNFSNTVIKIAEFMDVGDLAKTTILDEPDAIVSCETNET